MQNKGQKMYELIEKLFPICRSITGKGFCQSLDILTKEVPEITIHKITSGNQVFDWTIPKEWNIYEAYIETETGERIVDFKDNNLHVLGYSTPVNEWLSLSELLEHIYTMPEQPDSIPYVTSFYKERWGFCMTEHQKQSLKDIKYLAVVKSLLTDGHLIYGDLIIPGESSKEILITSYLCHPSMANNELSGPVVLVELMKYVKSLQNRKYTYRFVINPETIGSITYISRNLDILQSNVIAGFVLSCVGDNNAYSYLETPYADTLTDKVTQNVLKYHCPEFKQYSFLCRGSDERQYCSPLVNLPVVGICRSKYMEYPEYHTSADNMNYISPEGLQGAYDLMEKIINALEYNKYYKVTCVCEPQLGKRGLYPTISRKGAYDEIIALKDFLAYADGKNDLITISDRINQPIDVLIPIIDKLLNIKLIEIVELSQNID